MKSRTRSALRGGIAVEQLSVICLVGLAGVVGLQKLGGGMHDAVAGEGLMTAAAAPSFAPRAMATSVQAGVEGALVKAERSLSMIERANLVASPLGAHLALPADRAWARSVEYFMGKRISERRPLGETIRYGFEQFLAPKHTSVPNYERHIGADFKARLGLLETQKYPAIGAHLNGERFSRFVDDKLFDILAKDARVTLGAVDELPGTPFSFDGRELVLHGNTELMQGEAAKTDAILDQILERYALHLLEKNGAEPLAVYALHDYLVASERLRAAAVRRVNLHSAISKAEDDLATARLRLTHPDDDAVASSAKALAVELSADGRIVPEDNASRIHAEINRLESEIKTLEANLDTANEEVVQLHREEKAAASWYKFESAKDGSREGLLERMTHAADGAEAFRTSIGLPAAPRAPRARAVVDPKAAKPPTAATAPGKKAKEPSAARTAADEFLLRLSGELD